MHVTTETRFDEKNQLRTYQNDIARDLNQCIAVAESISEDIVDHVHGGGRKNAILQTVQRVAEFENIKALK